MGHHPGRPPNILAAKRPPEEPGRKHQWPFHQDGHRWCWCAITCPPPIPWGGRHCRQLGRQQLTHVVKAAVGAGLSSSYSAPGQVLPVLGPGMGGVGTILCPVDEAGPAVWRCAEAFPQFPIFLAGSFSPISPENHGSVALPPPPLPLPVLDFCSWWPRMRRKRCDRAPADLSGRFLRGKYATSQRCRAQQWISPGCITSGRAWHGFPPGTWPHD